MPRNVSKCQVEVSEFFFNAGIEYLSEDPLHVYASIPGCRNQLDSFSRQHEPIKKEPCTIGQVLQPKLDIANYDLKLLT